jgi:hypothetical protein
VPPKNLIDKAPLDERRAPWRRIEMERRFVPLRWTLMLALGCVAAQVSFAQQLPPTYNPETKFDFGQDIVPSFDGYVHNADGTYTMVFGYMNRNYKEELVIPVGPDNKMEPGSVDQGQATYFYPRRHTHIVLVKVPANWPPNQELVWTLTSHGRTEKAYASLNRYEEEVTPRTMLGGGTGFLLDGYTPDPNKPPTISVTPVTGASVGSPVTLNAIVSDDGLPKPRVVVPRPEVAGKKAQTNSAGGGRGGRRGLNVSWYEYRGPAKMTFNGPEQIQAAESGVPVTNAKALTTATFSVPGTYVLRGTVNDGQLSQSVDLTITVK